MPSPASSRRRLAAVIATVALAIPVGTALAAIESVSVVDNRFEPPTITVTVGGSVEWAHEGSAPHTVTASDDAWDSHENCNSFADSTAGNCMGNGDTYSQDFNEVGEFAYYCKLHGTPDGGGMAGTVVVQAAQDTGGDTGEDAADTIQAGPTGTISASDQTGDGTTVQVDSVSIDGASGFVVVHRDADGAPGEVVGHRAIPEGSSSNVTVTLDTTLEDSQALWPMLHVDAGQVGTYEFPGPDGPVTQNGSVVMVQIDYTVADEDDASTLPATGTDAGALTAAGLGALIAVLGGWMILRRRTQPTG